MSTTTNQYNEATAAARLAAAREAQPVWAALPISQRLAVLKRLRHLIADRAAELAAAIVMPQRRHLGETITAEVLPLADAIQFLETQAAKILAPRRTGLGPRPLWLWGTRLEVRRDPLGTILIIGPSNYPLFLMGVQLVQALAAGNAVLIKPGRGGTACAARLVELLADAGLPHGLVGLLGESPDDARNAITLGVDKIFVTGSATTGAVILADAAPHLTPVVAELSGCDAVFVLADADLSLLARSLIFGLTFNGSATCIAPRRVFVPRSSLPKLEALLADLARVIPALPVDPNAASRAIALVHQAINAGARPLTPIPAIGSTMTPVVLTDASAQMPLLESDIFAPVLSLVPVADIRHALRLAAECPFALGAAVFSDNPRDAASIAAELDVGCVVVNDVIAPTADPRLPFAGRKRSGFGVTRGAEGLLEMTSVKAIVTHRGKHRLHLDNAQTVTPRFAAALVSALHSGRLSQRLAAWFRLASLARSPRQ